MNDKYSFSRTADEKITIGSNDPFAPLCAAALPMFVLMVAIGMEIVR